MLYEQVINFNVSKIPNYKTTTLIHKWLTCSQYTHAYVLLLWQQLQYEYSLKQVPVPFTVFGATAH